MIPNIEFLSTEEIEAYQLKKLKETLVYLEQNSVFYKNLFQKKGIHSTSFSSLQDIEKFPFTTKADLSQYNQDFLCVPIHEIIDYSSTSGTLGDPVTFGLTDNDLDRLAYNEAISFACAGVQKGDLVQLMTTIDRRFMAGLAYFLGLRKLVAGVIRVGAGIPELQWDNILKHNPKYLISVPSFLLKMIEYAEKNNIDYNNSSVKGVICIGEPLRNQDFTKSALAEKITQKWNIQLFSTYASTEMNTAFTECEHQIGGHHHPELIYVELIDENNQVIHDDREGELVVTTLGVKGMPLLRYKTGDIVKIHKEKCACGRNTLRVGPVLGRKKHMIKYKGTTLYPPALLDLLSDFEEIKSHVIEISTNAIGTDEIVIKAFSENQSEVFVKKIKDHFKAKLRVSPEITFVSFEEISAILHNPKARKITNIVDNR